ncbi:amidohydrolase family protein [Sediminibacterium soli]|uniref:amidohydrolase family protein n=1 Tax=Sediminibacterium soli TaxID=2698829 RepID=UPI0013794392|nr:amidohydrolase family protein [Sediminibacterium soli]NCI48167.1 amidohydrolase family protein [Sediminibacterium soli]
MKRIVDTHLHIWDLGKADYPWLAGDNSLLNRSWLLDEMEPERAQAGVTAGVLVQAAGNLEDTRLMFETAAHTPWIAGVVAWLPLMDTVATQNLLENLHLKEKICKGIRHQTHDEPDPQWLLQPAVLESLKLVAAAGLTYDAVGILPAHIDTVRQLAEKLPELNIVFDHLNWPPIPATNGLGQWGRLMAAAAQQPNIFAKISGLGTASGNFAERTAEDIKPAVAFALEHFGTDRCFCGSDWPVSMLAGSYSHTWETLSAILSDLLSEAEQQQVLFTNADNFYQLGLNQPHGSN